MPDHLWEGHRDEVEAMREYMGWDFEKTNWDGMGMKFGQGNVYAWVKIQAGQIWAGEKNDWYENNVKIWLEAQGLDW